MKIKKKALISLVSIIGIFIFGITSIFAIDTGFEYATALDLGTRDIRASIMQVINVLMGFLGIIAIIVILAGGFKWMTASGSEDKVAEARKLIIAGIVGLAIILSSYAIAYFVIESLINATGAS